MKRFQFVGGRWIKSQKNVKFPLVNMNPYNYVVGHDDSYKATFASSDIVSLADSRNLNRNAKEQVSVGRHSEDNNGDNESINNSLEMESDTNKESSVLSSNLDSNEIIEVVETKTDANEHEQYNKNDSSEEMVKEDTTTVNDEENNDGNSSDKNNSDNADQTPTDDATGCSERRPLYNLYAIAVGSNVNTTEVNF